MGQLQLSYIAIANLIVKLITNRENTTHDAKLLPSAYSIRKLFSNGFLRPELLSYRQLYLYDDQNLERDLWQKTGGAYSQQELAISGLMFFRGKYTGNAVLIVPQYSTVKMCTLHSQQNLSYAFSQIVYTYMYMYK